LDSPLGGVGGVVPGGVAVIEAAKFKALLLLELEKKENLLLFGVMDEGGVVDSFVESIVDVDSSE
jgi:hypothetical protein